MATGQQAEVEAGLVGVELLSAATAPIWTAIILGLSTVFAFGFLRRSKSPSMQRFEERKRERYEELMRIVAENAKRHEQGATKQDRKEGLPDEEDEGDKDKDKDKKEGLPEAARLYDILWDDVKEVRTFYYGVSRGNPDMLYLEALLKRQVRKELEECISKTQDAWTVFTKPQGGGVLELDKEQAEHLDGEKLREKRDFLRDKVLKNLGGEFVAETMLRNADGVLQHVVESQRKNLNSLLTLIRPCIPALLISIVSLMVAQMLQAVYYQIARWQLVGDAAVKQNRELVMYHLFDLGMGHLVIWFFEFICETHSQRASGMFNQIIRSGVMRALVRQDTEYFDKNSAGALQERLNRDADQLGSNFIQLPQQMLAGIACVLVNLVQVYSVCPFAMFIYAIAPLPVIVFCHWKLQKLMSSLDERGRKVNEEAASNTAEVLREIKTVRQFANERFEAASFARSEVMRNELQERTTVIQKSTGTLFGVVIVAGLIFTEYIGAGLVQEGKMTPGLLFDITLKLNFWVVFKTIEIVNLAPQLRKALEPLGRVCTLLESSPSIESSSRLRRFTANSTAELEAVLAKCKTIKDEKRGRTLTVLTEALPLDDGESPVPQGTLILTFETRGEELSMWGKQELLDRELAFPTYLHFSVKHVPQRINGLIEFDNVVFRYPTDKRKLQLQGISFSVQPRQKVALVGEAGCGKTTCMALLQRLYDPEVGEVRIDGRPIKDYNVSFLRSRVVIVDQKPVLFASSVRENITYGLHYSVDDQTVIDILSEASLWDGDNGIKSKPDQLLTRLGSGGISLSGGQTQRLSIARAMIRNPDVILLDEATSALDNKNEKIVQKALDRLALRGSALVIAHRLTTIQDADKIIVIRKGKVAEEGTHKDLLAKQIVKETNEIGEEDVVDGIYKMLWELQFAKDPEDSEGAPKIQKVLKDLQRLDNDPQAKKVASAAYEAAQSGSVWERITLLKDKNVMLHHLSKNIVVSEEVALGALSLDRAVSAPQ